ncbi:MAG: pyruvate ferredoxin oxidoreductase [Candidatus Schekmanbacteria bacterium GWA2_38_9]|uniref:Pyruvate ferredoxin oxidoreductase n=1 Tax=Candidatus Schekmanbacteria bacterium RIFCSPLOWO2_12_FULL_38_15 TaxID=1817883 RepID=A0A1F7SNY4_9BACT|nr:MAG: pyruvate ferredoxin oxidoreductase [Candidatus Schekmanbacteria bacterium GWA2_38_9]OGL50306.1 MAG: pyruvate ferredoxin oxidoreductase [Candidatus Schekmanbacteria bacterium RIFCSPLOWO2_02_FULL_38_14]OGL55492.1 MAG: pyruvate ferredoxin oxidoreductase [Candidatus Schekmanbacteria bacterium RIFCSPLOWO2_12_FULL_38_15]
MIEIRFHGRGGQGAVVASKILSLALFNEGRHVQSFPIFGIERRGAPVAAFIRIDDEPIRLRTCVYEPDYVVVLHSTLIESVDVTEGLEKGGMILINTHKKPDDYPQLSSFSVATVDASSIAYSHGLGNPSSPIVNTAILGAFLKITEIVPFKSLEKAIAEEILVNTEKNILAARDAYKMCRFELKENLKREKAVLIK